MKHWLRWVIPLSVSAGLYFHRRLTKPRFARFEVRPTSRDEFEYREGDHRLRFGAELLLGRTNRAIDSGSIGRWLPPHEQVPLSAERCAEIQENIQAYFKADGITFTVD